MATHASASVPQRTRLPRAERERLVLDVAHARFAAHGYAAVTMEDVAADAGVTKPLIYAYFGNKERLYLACMERAGEALFATVGAAVSAADSPADALRRGLHAFFAFVDEDRDAWRVLFDETLPAGGEIAERVAEYRERLLALVAQTNLDRLPPQHRAAAKTEVEATSVALLGAAEALARWWLRTGAMPAAGAADLLIATAEPGLRARMAAGAGSTRTADAPTAVRGGGDVAPESEGAR
ncbi:MAG: TetR/AcrR family transcriptional regulator [Actinobacteria bacterium]|nr:TetR/AcrR family transcriptional regulator [Actinomycetota bacterium]